MRLSAFPEVFARVNPGDARTSLDRVYLCWGGRIFFKHGRFFT